LSRATFTTSLTPETWTLVGSGEDQETAEPFIIVGRNLNGQATTWRVQLTTNRNDRTDWRAVSHTDHLGHTVTYSSPRNLSHSHIDTILRRFAEPGDWAGTEWVPYA
jgi:hypothetical protein